MIKHSQYGRTAAYFVLCASSLVSLSLQASTVGYDEYNDHEKTAKPCCEDMDKYRSDYFGKEIGKRIEEIKVGHQDGASEFGKEVSAWAKSDHDGKSWKEGWQDHDGWWQKRHEHFDEYFPGNGKHCNINPPPAVPVPGAIWLFLSGFIGMLGYARRKAH